MKNFFHYVLAMLYLKIAHHKAANSAEWFRWIEKSQNHANDILRSLNNE